MATSKGLFAFDRSTGVSFSTTMHGPSGSGANSESANCAAEVDADTIAREALDTAIAAQEPREIEPGDYTVIFEPQAVADLLEYLFWSMDARDADEGTTAFAGKVGEKFLHESVTISTEIDNPRLPACCYGADGLPARRTTWVENGVLKRLRHDRFWARERGAEPDPMFRPVFMKGEDRSVEELVAQCDRGLLVKRLWYIRHVDFRELLLTGMTRDGLFLVQGGKVAGAVKNLRFNESPIVFLKNVVAMSRPARVGGIQVPGVMSTDFTFSSKTESL
jgi:predicted Zn-dependent protease